MKAGEKRKNFFIANTIHFLDRLPHSPDLNPIQNVYIKQQQSKGYDHNFYELWKE